MSKVNIEQLKEPGVTISCIYYYKPTSSLYIGTSMGLLVLRNGEIEILNQSSGLAVNSVSSVNADQKGNLWVSYNGGPLVLSKYDGNNWSHYNVKDKMRDIIYDTKNHLWYVAFTNDLSRFDGKSFSPLTVIDKDPRFWWRQKTLQELAQEETITVDIHDVLKHPFDYRGKKISFTGKIVTGWEYIDIIDEQGNGLGILPEPHKDLKSILKMTPKTTLTNGPNVEESQFVEFVGYLEYQGSYGHLGSRQFLLFIIEERPRA